MKKIDYFFDVKYVLSKYYFESLWLLYQIFNNATIGLYDELAAKRTIPLSHVGFILFSRKVILYWFYTPILLLKLAVKDGIYLEIFYTFETALMFIRHECYGV